MEIIYTPSEYIKFRHSLSTPVGFVPTMGALHAGHQSLIERSKKENKKTVVSIFVNPTQFGHSHDLEMYPKTWEKDLELLKASKVDALFYPKYEDLYLDNYKYNIHENEVSTCLEGEFRKGHFNGVMTIVLKLLLIIKPDRAYFGEKDYQQYLLIKGLKEAFFLETEIVPCQIVREESGLALSSRNMRLTKDEQKLSASIFKELKSSSSIEEKKENLKNLGFDVEYLEEKYKRLLIACNISNVRLIDNVPL